MSKYTMVILPIFPVGMKILFLPRDIFWRIFLVQIIGSDDGLVPYRLQAII